MPETEFEKANPNASLDWGLMNSLAKIVQAWGGLGKNVGEMFVKEMEEISKSVAKIKTIDALNSFIKDYPFQTSFSRPKLYKNSGCFNSDHLFLEYRFLRGEGDRHYAVLGFFFPALFQNQCVDDLKLFCRNWEEKIKNPSNIEFFFATYND